MQEILDIFMFKENPSCISDVFDTKDERLPHEYLGDTYLFMK